MEVKMENRMEKIVSLAKRRGFIYPSSDIYGGLAGTWDYGPLGVLLRNNIKDSWWKKFVLERNDMYGVDASILMNTKVWESSGHVGGFADPLVVCEKCKKEFRADQLEDKNKCVECGGNLGSVEHFNMMLKTHMGVKADSSSLVYLRPETAQGMFVNFKNIIDSFHPKLPFGMAQTGKAFRNEIAPRDFLFRTREFEQMEIEYFIDPPENDKDWNIVFESWRSEIKNWLSEIGFGEKSVHELEVAKEDLAHYSKRTIDFEYEYPFGKKELLGLAYRTDFDLKAHGLTYLNEETKQKIIPHVIEPSFGVERLILALLCEVYTEDTMNDETRTFLKFKPSVAPIKVAIFPLLKNKPELVEKAKEVYDMLKGEITSIIFDDNGNIGKRYRRQDEIGTPFCVTIDFDSLEDDTVTVRDRDIGEQNRMKISELNNLFKEKITDA